MSGSGRRRRVLVVVVAGSVLLGVGGVVAASWVRSPQEVAAEHAPPEASVLSAVVEERVLADTVVVRGQVSAAGTFEVAPGVSAEGKAVVTGLRAVAGAEVTAGLVLLEVSGRPVVGLPGAVPAYRDLRPGAEGADVAQLQAALAALDFGAGSDDKGVFGPGTEDAVEEFYDSIGYPVVTTGDEAEVDAAEKQVRAAQRALGSARDALKLAKEAAKAAPPTPAPGEPDPVRAAEGAVELAEEDLSDARSAVTQIAAVSGPVVPLGEYVFLPTFPARVQEVTAKVGDEVAGPLLTLSSGALVVNTRVDPTVRGLLAEEMPAQVLAEMTGATAAGTITAIGEATEDEQLGFGHPVTITPDEPLPAELAGQDVRVTITAAATPGPVLVVPVSAVSATAAGETVVVKIGEGGATERVPVTVGVSGDGFLEVAPITGGALTAGDSVVIGK